MKRLESRSGLRQCGEFHPRTASGTQGAKIGRSGTKLSGGQRQRTAIVRALLRDPRVLILEEATSALQAGSEAVVQLALQRLMAGRSSSVIAHHPNVLRRVDQAVVLDKGLIVKSGVPAGLLQLRDGQYAKMQRNQAVCAVNR